MSPTGHPTDEADQPSIVRTKISGIILSLPSEGKRDLEDVVMLSEGVTKALHDWSRLPVADYSDERRERIVKRLIAEAVGLFGVTPAQASVYSEMRADTASRWAQKP